VIALNRLIPAASSIGPNFSFKYISSIKLSVEITLGLV